MEEKIKLCRNTKTGTIHIKDPDTLNPVCGESPLYMAGDSPTEMLEKFPSDFGLVAEECEKCAEINPYE